MTTPESSSFDLQSGRASDFEAGIAAFQQADYATAIVLLEPALAESADQPLIVRAQMGLAIAYEKMGETQRAAELCQSLQHHKSSQVQEWANQTLASLTKRHPELALQMATFDARSSSASLDERSSHNLPLPDEALESSLNPGFTPLDQTSLPPVSEQEWSDLSASIPSTSGPIAPLPVSSSDPISPPSERPPTSRLRQLQTSSASLASPSLYQPHWRQAGRAQNWKPLGTVNLLKLALAQVVTAIACYIAVQQMFYWIAASYGNAIVKTLPRLGFRIVQPGDPTWTYSFTLIILLILLIGSRWILDGLLTLLYGLKPCSIHQLSGHSPETASSLARYCRKSKIPVPTLGILPTATPIIFSYGIIPHVSRIVISQGVLDQLADDEIATLYAREVGNLAQWTAPLMSGIVVLLQLPFTLYWLTAEWGNQKGSPITKASAILISVISYSVFWLWRWVPLWLSRQRTYYSDRIATDLTGNPNGYTRALVKLAIATAKDVEQQGQVSYLLEGFEALTPLGYRIAIPLGSVYPYAPLEQILNWGRIHPLRHWLAINNTHPPTGERLNLLMIYARHWQLNTELDWQEMSARRAQTTGLSAQQWRSLLLQGAPYFGFGFGVILSFLLRLIGWTGQRFRWEWVSWMATDRTILIGLPLVGLCIGILLRLNPFFPELERGVRSKSPDSLLSLVSDVSTIPLTSTPTQLEGTMLGRRGISNLLNQDLWLQTPNGVVKLHCIDRFGVLNSLIPAANRPATLVKSSLLATGWFRQGATPWLDVNTLRTTGGRVYTSYHPVWGFVIAAIAAIWGILVIFNFRF